MKIQLLVTSILLFGGIVWADKAYVGILVKDAVTGSPVQGVSVIARFEDDIGWRIWSEEPNPDIVSGVTDQEGFCRLSGKTNCGRGGIRVETDPVGYYMPQRGGHIDYSSKSLLGVWQPENVVFTMALQRVEHPIPLYVRDVSINEQQTGIIGFDGTNLVLKYDFVMGDWLPPHGDGKYADMIISSKYKVNECVNTGRGHSLKFYEFVNSIEFLGKGNGLVENSFADTNFGIKIRCAPESGYAEKKILNIGQRRKTGVQGIWPEIYTESDKSRCYSFRIRSRLDENGNLISANYGKIYGDFNFSGRDDIGLYAVEFLYYLNPTSLDRNLEWNRKTNLCPNPGYIIILQP